MESTVALGAIRRISVDVANLTGQLALMQSGVEFVRQVANEVRPDSWTRAMGEDAEGHADLVITLRGDQVDAVMRLLAALDVLS
jgi:hypothetical protein